MFSFYVVTKQILRANTLNRCHAPVSIMGKQRGGEMRFRPYDCTVSKRESEKAEMKRWVCETVILQRQNGSQAQHPPVFRLLAVFLSHMSVDCVQLRKGLLLLADSLFDIQHFIQWQALTVTQLLAMAEGRKENRHYFQIQIYRGKASHCRVRRCLALSHECI